MRYLLILLTFLFSTFIFSQELSQSYLESLPDDIKEDVLKRVEGKADDERKVYRSVDAISDIEKIKSTQDELEDEDRIPLFGDNFFNTFQTSFMPINLPNLDDSYVLDFGDVLDIHLVGQVDVDESFQLKRDGSISIPDIGKLYLAGLSLSDASDLIRSRVNEAFIQTKTFITLSNIRDVSILVAGNAFNPGVYTLNGSSNILHALSVAGGINNYGSYRNIKLIRENEVIEKFDLYDILIEGKYALSERLRNGDIVFIESRNKVLSISGAVKRPGSYELLDSQSLSELLTYANGITPDADLDNISISRIINGSIRILPIANLEQLNSLDSIDGDSLDIRKHSFRSVTLTGAVIKPGAYVMTEGDSIADLIQKAGGFSKNAYPFGAVYLNKAAMKIADDATLKLYNDFVDNLIELLESSQSGQLDITPLISIAEELKATKATGRVTIDLESTNNEENFYIQHNDILHIPEKTKNVFVYGEVYNNGAVFYKENADLDYYIEESAGLKSTADNKSIYVLMPNGSTQRFSRSRNLFESSPSNQDVYIHPGSVIFIPRKVNNSVANRLTAQAYATILGNIGVTLASLSVLDGK